MLLTLRLNGRGGMFFETLSAPPFTADATTPENSSKTVLFISACLTFSVCRACVFFLCQPETHFRVSWTLLQMRLNPPGSENAIGHKWTQKSPTQKTLLATNPLPADWTNKKCVAGQKAHFSPPHDFSAFAFCIFFSRLCLYYAKMRISDLGAAKSEQIVAFWLFSLNSRVVLLDD
jgi:hypothetical protein